MAARDIIVIGASAGGCEALQKVAGMFPVDVPAAVFITCISTSAARAFCRIFSIVQGLCQRPMLYTVKRSGPGESM
jgi:hypothetical protein